ncbi:hypothetical protein DYB35_013714 [Aphanomyces astaci]|uniref:Uncharacterized protein n=1 Tax=Aphanomyces astaci TaxID=112090 RepID=A0A3R7E5V6_APHAT|nr:hypothetical protein DYB35_013714 [Aphanomyces astaci]
MMVRSGLRPSKLPTDSARSLPNTTTQRPQTMPPSHGGSSYHEFNQDHPTRTLGRAPLASKAASFGPPTRHVQSSSSSVHPPRTHMQDNAPSNHSHMHPLPTHSTDEPVQPQPPPTQQPHPMHPLPIGRQRSEPIMVPTVAANSSAFVAPPTQKRHAVPSAAATAHSPPSAHLPRKKVDDDDDDDDEIHIMMDDGDAGKNSFLDTEHSSVDDGDDAETLSSMRDVRGIRERAKLIRSMSKNLHMPPSSTASMGPNTSIIIEPHHRRNDTTPILATRITSLSEHDYASDEEEF